MTEPVKISFTMIPASEELQFCSVLEQAAQEFSMILTADQLERAVEWFHAKYGAKQA